MAKSALQDLERERETYQLTSWLCSVSVFKITILSFFSIGRHVNLGRAVDCEGAEINICKNQNIILIPHETHMTEQSTG